VADVPIISRLYRRYPLLRFATVGASGAVIALVLMYLLTSMVHLHYLLSYAACFVVSVTSNYILNTRFTFRQQGSASGLGRYALVSLFTLGINELVVFVLTSSLGLWYLLSTAISIAVSFLVNYGLSRKIVWGTKHAAGNRERGPETVL
jgi:putative flippase GtrA